jgi:ribosomal protein L29
MIHVQNWKIYSSHYDNDSTEIGFELKKEQLHYKQYGEQMGVPVTDEIVFRAQRPSDDDIFPYLFDGTTIEDYNQAKYIEQNNNCITVREWHERVVTRIDGGIITAESAAQMPDNTIGSADDYFSDNLLGEVEDDTPMKKKQLFEEYETPSKKRNELLRFQNTQTFLSPTTKELQMSIEKAASSVTVVYNTHELKAARKNILQSVDHILSHELVMENPLAAEFVAELETKVQEIKEQFTKTVHSISGKMQGNEGELTFPAFERRKRKHVDK